MKINIPQPSKFLFETVYTVTITDINYGGHLGNDKYLSIVHECRTRFFQFLGFSERNIGDENVGTIMANSIINYKAEAFHNDKLTIKIGVAEVGKASFDLVYFIFKQNQLVAEVLTTIVAFHTSINKPTRIPQKFLDKLETFTT